MFLEPRILLIDNFPGLTIREELCLVLMIWSLSAICTMECDSGLSLNQRNQKIENITPKTPKNTNVYLQPIESTNPATMGSANAAPIREPEKLIPWTIPLSLVGNHVYITFDKLGNAPASPAPNRNRMIRIELKLHAAAVRAVSTDQIDTIDVMETRAPTWSANLPEMV